MLNEDYCLCEIKSNGNAASQTNLLNTLLKNTAECKLTDFLCAF
ncbi:hypothetical protein PALB_29410 [Pseudoalteromonas luteoviolacea B = ATCC 29581]|nr:hypothetical protein PALB_29410 [Pseudoalteromonas luteoviolacea B = ATCC 29581]